MEKELDKALLPAPWLAKRDNNDKSFLIASLSLRLVA
jgi:hypothetical protein